MSKVEIKITGELKSVELKPGDVVLMRVPVPLAPEQRAHIHRYLEEAFPGHKCVVLENGAELSILRPDCEVVAH